MHIFLTESLVCPACHGRLDWNLTDQRGEQIEAAQIHCENCTADYFVRDGIGVFLLPDLPRNDLWERAETELVRYLHEHPELERHLLRTPMEALSPADQFFRALVLEEQGEFAEAKEAEDLAQVGLYTPEYRACLKSQMDYVIDYLSGVDSPVFDLASGRGYLVEVLVRQIQAPIIASDFSLRVLRRNGGWLMSAGLYDRVSLLAFDARQTPFKNGAIQYLTTNQGLANIEQPGDLLKELRRIVSGTFLAISHGYPENDGENWKVIRDLGLEARMLNVHSALELFQEVGWEAEIANLCEGQAQPTPAGVILEGAKIDELPAAETRLEWCVLVAKSQK